MESEDSTEGDRGRRARRGWPLPPGELTAARKLTSDQWEAKETLVFHFRPHFMKGMQGTF